MSTQALLDELTPEQKIRVLAMDAVTGSGGVEPEDWVKRARELEEFLKGGTVTQDKTFSGEVVPFSEET